MVRNAFASGSGEDGSSKRRSSAGADDSNEERPKGPQMKGESKIAKGIIASLKASRKSDSAAASKAEPSHGREGRAAGATLAELKPLEEEGWPTGSGKSNGSKGKGKRYKKGKSKAERPATEVLEVEKVEETKEEGERRAKRQKRFGEVEKKPEPPARATRPADSSWRSTSGEKAGWKQESSDGQARSWRERPPKGEGKGKKDGKTGEDESRKPSEPPPAHKGLRGWDDKDEVAEEKKASGSAAAID